MSAADGTFHFDGMDISGTYLKAVRLGQQDLFGKSLDLTSGTGGELETTLLMERAKFPVQFNRLTLKFEWRPASESRRSRCFGF